MDAIIFAHEYQHIGTPRFFSRTTQDQEQKKRDANSLATFLITTLLLPALLVAPAERDIRVINVVNPFYAAAAGLPFSPSFLSTQDQTSSKGNSILLQEGRRSLRTIVFTRHLQRVLDALPAAQVPKTDQGSKTVPVVSSKAQRSNIVAISASPGISRVDTISNLLNADFMSPSGSLSGLFLSVFLPNSVDCSSEVSIGILHFSLFSASSPNPPLRPCKHSFTSFAYRHLSRLSPLPQVIPHRTLLLGVL